MSTGHENGGWMNSDQRDSHPEPFVFLSVIDDRPFKAARWGGEWWFFYWHEAQKSWVSHRPALPEELRLLRQRALPPEQAKLYDDMHEKRQIGIELLKEIRPRTTP